MKVHGNLAADWEVLLFLDLSRALNFVDVETLIAKFYELVIRGKFSEWIRSFLTNRPQYVEIKSDKPEVLCHKCPDGSASRLGV